MILILIACLVLVFVIGFYVGRSTAPVPEADDDNTLALPLEEGNGAPVFIQTIELNVPKDFDFQDVVEEMAKVFEAHGMTARDVSSKKVNMDAS